MKHNNIAVVAVVGLFAALVGGNASAVLVTETATNVSYTYDNEKLGLFGAPTLVGENLVFTSTNFMATASAPSATSTFNVTVTALSGYQLTAFSLEEQGGYSLGGGSVYVSGSLYATDIEGNPNTTFLNSSLVPSLANNAWTASAGVNLPATGWGGTDGIVNSVSLTLSNQLFVMGSASVYKDLVTLSSAYTAVTPIPEAENYALMLVGLGLVGFMVRRRARIAV